MQDPVVSLNQAELTAQTEVTVKVERRAVKDVQHRRGDTSGRQRTEVKINRASGLDQQGRSAGQVGGLQIAAGAV